MPFLKVIKFAWRKTSLEIIKPFESKLKSDVTNFQRKAVHKRLCIEGFSISNSIDVGMCEVIGLVFN